MVKNNIITILDNESNQVVGGMACFQQVKKICVYDSNGLKSIANNECPKSPEFIPGIINVTKNADTTVVKYQSWQWLCPHPDTLSSPIG